MSGELGTSTVAEEVAVGIDRDALFQSLYPELKKLARSRLRTVGGRTTLNTTTLVHDAYARLAASRTIEFPDKGRFLAYCGQVMRSVIIDLARERLSERRGGGVADLELNTELMHSTEQVKDDSLDVLNVHQALSQLKALDPRLETVVEMRYFAGMTEPEVAEALGLSVRTVNREWERARALLRAVLSE